ncbi:MAG: OmpH family outer membrane protein [Balneolaceae bacterium]
MRKILLTLLLSSLPLFAAAQLQVGIMNPQQVLEALPEMDQVRTDLESFVEQRQQEFTTEYSSWIESMTEFDELVEQGILSGSEREEREEELREREQALGTLEQQIRTRIQQRQSQLLSPIMDRVETTMEEIAEQHGLDIVINELTSEGEPIVYFSSEEGVRNITQEVIQQLVSN